MVTGWPSKRISPPSVLWIPATHLISVDFPAPLSPTSAITSPSRTSKSTPRSASTEPKLLKTSRSSSVAVAAAVAIRAVLYHGRGSRNAGPGRERSLLAVLLVRTDADLASLQEAIGEEELVVLLRYPDRGQQDRLRPAGLPVHARDLLVLDDRDGRGRCGVGLLAYRLVDRSGLPAGEDELDAGRRRVLPRQRDRLQALGLQRGDDRAREAVVGRDHGVDLVPVACEHLVEDRATLDRAPVGVLAFTLGLLERAVGPERVQHRAVALAEQLGVVVGDAAVQPSDDRVLAVLPARFQLRDETGAHQAPDSRVVERDVVRGLAAHDQTVVVDHLRVLLHSEV